MSNFDGIDRPLTPGAGGGSSSPPSLVSPRQSIVEGFFQATVSAAGQGGGWFTRCVASLPPHVAGLLVAEIVGAGLARSNLLPAPTKAAQTAASTTPAQAPQPVPVSSSARPTGPGHLRRPSGALSATAGATRMRAGLASRPDSSTGAPREPPAPNPCRFHH